MIPRQPVIVYQTDEPMISQHLLLQILTGWYPLLRTEENGPAVIFMSMSNKMMRLEFNNLLKAQTVADFH